jgi:hypothetical protein
VHLLRDGESKKTQTEIPDNAMLQIYLLDPFSPTESKKPQEKFIYVACEDSDNAYIMVQNDRFKEKEQAPSIFVFSKTR